MQPRSVADVAVVVEVPEGAPAHRPAPAAPGLAVTGADPLGLVAAALTLCALGLSLCRWATRVRPKGAS